MFCIHTITASSGKPLLPVARPPHLRHYRVYVPVRTAGYQLRQTCAATVPSDVYSENSHLRSRLCPFRSASRTVSGYREYPPIRFLEWGGRKGFAFLASPDRSVEATPAVGFVRQSGNGDIRMYASLYAAPFRLV